MTHSLTLLATLFASATDPAPAVDARWVTNTIPAIAVHLTDPDHTPVEGRRVVLHGPGDITFDNITGPEGSTTSGFLAPGFWHVVVYDRGRPSQDVWVELQPRQRAELTLQTTPGTIADLQDPLQPPVIDASSASRGAVFRMGALVARPL